jgi:hypothetical protein
MKECPYCYSVIPKPATVCRICQRDLTVPPRPTVVGFTVSSTTTVTLGSSEPTIWPVGRALEKDTASPVTWKKTYHPKLSYPHVGMSVLRTLCEGRSGDREPVIRIDAAGAPPLQMYDVTMRELADQGYVASHPDDLALFALTEQGKQYCEGGRERLSEYPPLG